MDKERERAKVIKEVKRACPSAIWSLSAGANPAQIRSAHGIKLKKHIRRLLTKYSRLCYNQK